MSSDAWLHALKTDPAPEFRERVRDRLRRLETRPEARHPWRRQALVAGIAVVTCAVLLSVPGVRAAVAQFVSLFRVVHFVAVPVDASRLERLESEHLDIGALIGEHVQVVRDPGPPVSVLSLADAAAAAGMPLALPQWLPEGTTVLETAVVGERVVRVTASGERLQQVMDALGISDLTVPAGLDGHVVDVHVPPVVMIRYDHGRRRSRLLQARTPQLTLPDRIDVQALGEIGLRILGLAPAEAKQFAGAIDWHTTLIVPVPPNVSSFRQVDIGGHVAVMMQHQPRDQSPTQTVIWSTPDRVFVLMSIEDAERTLAMANSVR